MDPDIFDLLLGWLRDCKIGLLAVGTVEAVGYRRRHGLLFTQRPRYAWPSDVRKSRFRAKGSSPAMPKVPPEQLQDFQVAVDFLGLRSYLDVEGFGRDGWASELSKEEPPPRAATGAASPERSFLKAAGAFLAPWRGAETQASEVPAHVAPALGAGVEPVEPPAEPPKVVGWSRKGSDPAVQHEEATICCMPDTRALRKSCAARATRGYQSGTHRFGVKLLPLGDPTSGGEHHERRCFVGLVASAWTGTSQALGTKLAPSGTWAVASDGSTWAAGRELEMLPVSFGEGDLVIFELDLPARGLRSATLVVDERTFEHVFTDLPETVYPAVSNLGSSCRFQLLCDLQAEAARTSPST
ncbi:unnamed protein product [Durusdinium trenchii]|uniref:B30.2/SPRY domain-containing protein n=1 Tax=Durusdinium trenchii TaxID=1381693 RepID=A0ABP0N6A6_9DINO